MELLLFRAMIFPLFLLLISSSLVYIVAQDCGPKKITKTIVVDKSGNTEFTTIQEAIDSIKENNNQWVKVRINAGTYREKVQIPKTKPCIYLEGADRDSTIITYDDHQQTDTSATFSSFTDNIIARCITFKNCIINVTSSGYVTAHGRNEKKDSSGFVFKGGKVIGNGKTMLGRAYGPFSRVIFYETYLSSVVAPEGWSAWKSKEGSGTNFIEADCKGPGANTSGRVPWSKKLDSSKLEKYTRGYFIDRDDIRK
ncbi:unnamed protein product [Lupinus luteus]|uniref:pectinesterase n=1 Tax=Lupinus luteus TaxID=3873 RepID=A0AAV1XH97_LUPLU